LNDDAENTLLNSAFQILVVATGRAVLGTFVADIMDIIL